MQLNQELSFAEMLGLTEVERGLPAITRSSALASNLSHSYANWNDRLRPMSMVLRLRKDQGYLIRKHVIKRHPFPAERSR